MCRGHNQVRSEIFRARADLLSGMTDVQRRLDLDAFPIGLSHKIVHLFECGVLRLLHEQRKTVSRVFIARYVILQMNRMQQHEF